MTRHRLLLSAALMLGLAAPAALAQEKTEADKPKTESVDFRKLKELMPETLGALKRTENNGEKNKLGEISITTCRAVFQEKKDDDRENAPRVEVEIMDYSGTGGAALGLAMVWAQTEIDKESDDGYERTIKIKDNPGHEEWNKSDKHGQVQVVVAKRYLVTVRTDHLPAGEAKKLTESLPLDKLAALK